MMSRSKGWVRATGVTLCLLAGPAAGALVAGEPVPLYTNEDLDRLAPLPQDAEPIAPAPDDWEFILAMLERERARQEAETLEQLERERIQAAIRIALEEDEDRFGRRHGIFSHGLFTVPLLIPEPRPPRGRTAREIDLDRIRVPLSQRGIRTAGDDFRESVEASRQRFDN